MSDLKKALKKLKEDKNLKEASVRLNKLIKFKKTGRLSEIGEAQLRKGVITSINKSQKVRIKRTK